MIIIKKVTKNIISILILGLIIKTISLLYKIIVTRMIGLEGMKIIAIISPMLALALSLSSFQTHIVTKQNISSNILNGITKVRVILLSGLKITLTSSSIISLFILASAPLYNYVYNDITLYYPMIICIPLIFIANIEGLIKAYLEAYEKFYFIYITNTIEMILKIALTIIPLLLFKNLSIINQVIIVFFSMLFSELISLILLALKLKKHINKTNIRTKTNKFEIKLLKQALPLTIESIILSLVGYITPFIYYFALNKIGISTDEGITYFALVTSYAIPLLLCGQFPVITIANVMFSNIAKNLNNRKETNKTIEKSIILAIPIAFLIFILCFSFPKESLLFLYNEEASYKIVKFMAPIYLFLYFNPIFIATLQARKKEKLLLITTIIAEIISLILIYLFSSMPLFNSSGYIIGIAISSLIRFIILAYLSLKDVKYKITYKLIIEAIIGLIYLVINLAFSSFLTYFISTLLFFPLYLLLFYFLYKNK